MAITLQSYPAGDNLSRYFAVNNPLIFTFAMTGRGAGAFNVYSVTALTVGSGTGNTTMIFSGNLTTTITPGDIVLIDGSLIRTVLSVIYDSMQKMTFIAVDSSIPFGNNINVSSIQDYRAEIRVFQGKKELSAGGLVNRQVGVEKEITSDGQGIVRFNVQQYLKPFVSFDQSLFFDHSKNTPDRGLWGRFILQYRERYAGDGLGIDDNWQSTQMRWYISAVKQLKNPGSVSMFPQARIFNGSNTPLQFLTSFEMPEYYPGYPNEISFIWPDVDGMRFLQVTEKKLNQKKQVQDTTITVLGTNGRQEVNRILLKNETQPGFVTVQIEQETDPTESYVAPNYVEELYFETI